MSQFHKFGYTVMVLINHRFNAVYLFYLLVLAN